MSRQFSPPSRQSRWYPTHQQLRDTPSIAAAFKQLLDQHYELADAHAKLLEKVNAPATAPKGPPPGSGPTDTQLLGLRVSPVDTQTLANGATLKYNAVSGNFEFS